MFISYGTNDVVFSLLLTTFHAYASVLSRIFHYVRIIDIETVN